MLTRIEITGEAYPWPRWAGWLLAAMLSAMLVCVIIDRDASKVLDALGWVLLAVMAGADREGRSWKRLGIAVAGALVVIVAAGALAFFAGEFAGAIYNFVKYQVGVLWLVVAWLAVPVFARRLKIVDLANGCNCEARWVKVLVALLLAFAAQATFSAAASMFPKDSMKLLGAELLPYAGLFIVLVRAGGGGIEYGDEVESRSGEQFSGSGNHGKAAAWWHIGLRCLWLITVAASLGMALITILALVSPGLGKAFLEADLFRVDSDAPGTYRLQFLFHHHNRAGFFAACAIFLCLAGAWGRTAWKVLGITGAAGAAIALPFTLTRGALVAAAAGMMLFTIVGLAGYRRGRWALLLGLIIAAPVLWALLPDDYQDHIAKIANIRNYREDSGGSIGARLIMWETAVDMIEKRPALGFGYGFENFESAARADHPNIPNYFKDAVHAHNQWLETAAESGLPGLVLLVMFTVVRIAGLAVAWWKRSRARRPLAWLLLLWLSIEVTIQIYGLTNYTLRRNLGYLTYAVWAGSVVLPVVRK